LEKVCFTNDREDFSESQKWDENIMLPQIRNFEIFCRVLQPGIFNCLPNLQRLVLKNIYNINEVMDIVVARCGQLKHLEITNVEVRILMFLIVLVFIYIFFLFPRLAI
jgi:hypothetical protein